MRKLFVLFLFLILLTIVFLLQKSRTNYCQNKSAIVYKLENKKYCLLVADSPDEWTKGLMNVRKPVDFDGMIFIFPDKQRQTFWNMNTYIDLDVYWLTDNKVVGKSYLLSIEKSKEIVTVNSGKKINKVVEIIIK